MVLPVKRRGVQEVSSITGITVGVLVLALICCGVLIWRK
ncbi:hypothetical protein NFI96_027927, partial [Prochilodus magdalenae]